MTDQQGMIKEIDWDFIAIRIRTATVVASTYGNGFDAEKEKYIEMLKGTLKHLSNEEKGVEIIGKEIVKDVHEIRFTCDCGQRIYHCDNYCSGCGIKINWIN